LTKRIAYLGPPGTNGEQAVLAYDRSAETAALASHTAVVEAVLANHVDEGMVALENSLEGAVSETLDALIRNEGVFVRAELVLPIEHHLIAAKGISLKDVSLVMSHPQALAQCRGFLASRLPGVEIEAALSTAAAVAAAVQTPGAAAIGSRRAAELNGGVILAERVQDVALNKTRFLVLGRDDRPATGDDKTSIAFTVAHDQPGSLIGVLQELSSRGLNMTRIESRPSREDLGIYIFLIDFQGHKTDSVVAAALSAVEAKSTYFRLFGSYPRFVEAI
jgi:prephenate dehydratase